MFKDVLIKLGLFFLGIVLGAAIAVGVMKKNEDFWYADIKKDNMRLSIEIKKLDQRKIEAMDRAMKIYFTEIRKIFPLMEFDEKEIIEDPIVDPEK